MCFLEKYGTYTHTQKRILNVPRYVITAISSITIPSPFHPTPLSPPTQNTKKRILSQRQINVGLPTSQTPQNKEEM